MPRDKTASHQKIMAAAMQEFMENGYDQARLRAVADAVGMTSAALYRHFDGKEAMFATLVQPAVDAVDVWKGAHIQASMDALDETDFSRMWDFDSGASDMRLVLDVMYAQPDVFYLLLFKSSGSAYENWMHDMIEESTDQMMQFVKLCRSLGYPAREIERSEMHILVTAYMMAMIEPLEHRYSREEAAGFLRLVQEFFTPGWRMITGT